VCARLKIWVLALQHGTIDWTRRCSRIAVCYFRFQLDTLSSLNERFMILVDATMRTNTYMMHTSHACKAKECVSAMRPE
jgi:hypothetical protein